VIEYTV